ncbi:uncharacterized protein ACNS7B_006343 isoform 1-T2 [Menidia menidia]
MNRAPRGRGERGQLPEDSISSLDCIPRADMAKGKKGVLRTDKKSENTGERTVTAQTETKENKPAAEKNCISKVQSNFQSLQSSSKPRSPLSDSLIKEGNDSDATNPDMSKLKKALDDSDDEPLMKLKKAEQDKKENTPPKPSGTEPAALLPPAAAAGQLLFDHQSFSSGSNTDGDSDNEPLVKMAKVSSKAARKPRSAAPRKSASRKKRASPQKDDSSDDDEPLSQIAKKVRDQYPRRRAAMASKKPPPGRQIPADGGQEKREIRGDVQRPQLRGRAAGRGQEEEELRGAQRAEELPCQAGSQQPSRQQLRGGRGPAGGPGEEKTSEEEHKEEPQGQGVGAEERTLRAELRGRAAPRATGGQDHPPQLRLPGEQLATC